MGVCAIAATGKITKSSAVRSSLVMQLRSRGLRLVEQDRHQQLVHRSAPIMKPERAGAAGQLGSLPLEVAAPAELGRDERPRCPGQRVEVFEDGFELPFVRRVRSPRARFEFEIRWSLRGRPTVQALPGEAVAIAPE